MSEILLNNGSFRKHFPQIKGNRGRIEIMGDILSVCIAGNIKKTHIMYRGNLSHDMLKAYTDELRKRGLVEFGDGSGKFWTTEKGKEFLYHYEQIKELLASGSESSEAPDNMPAGSKLLSLGMNQDFLKKVKISADQARDMIKGILYLKERYRDGNAS
jgi:predicted transcriptional regulator